MELRSKKQLEYGIVKHRNNEWEKLEKILLTIDGGTLAASVGFFAGKTSITYPELLRASWVLLSLSLVCLLLSYIFSDLFDRKVLNDLEDASEMISGEEFKTMLKSWNYYMANIANYAALIFCIIGIIALAAFGYFSLLSAS